MIQTTGGNATDKLVTRVGYGDFPANSGNGWTVFIQFKYNAAITGGKYASIFNLFSGLTDFTDPYVFIGSGPDADNVFVEAFNGTTTTDSATQAIVTSDQNWIGISYTPSTHVIGVIVNDIFVGDFIIDLSSVTFDALNILGDGAAGTKSAISVAYCRGWSRVLMASELTTEATTILASTSTGLLWDCPLQAGVDLTSHNNTLNQLTATGVVTTDLVDPLLSVISAPPTNTLPGTAMTVTEDSAIFQNTLASGSAAPFTWYKRTCTEDRVWGAIAFGDLTTFRPTIDVYEGLANANADITYLNISNNPNTPIQFPAVAGNDYFFRSRRNSAVSPATVIISILDALNLPAPIGSIAVNSEVVDFPLALLDEETAYPIRFINPFPAGEGGNPLSNGTTLVVNIADNNLKLFNSTLTLIGTVALTGDLSTRMSSNETSTFLVGITDGAIATFKLVSSLGVIDPTDFDTPSTAFRAIGLDVNATVAYYADNGTTTNQPVKSWDLVNNVAMANLVSGVTDYVIDKDIVVLQDGTILVARNKNTVTRNFKIIRYNSGGTPLSTYDLGDNSNNDNRIASDFTTTNFWAWIKGRASTSNDGFNIFKKIKVSDGSILISSPEQPQYDGGTYTPSTIINTPIRFGASESCPFWITRTVIGPDVNAASGLYNLSGTGNTARLLHDRLWIDAAAGTDESVAIPNPFTESYLAGDE